MQISIPLHSIYSLYKASVKQNALVLYKNKYFTFWLIKVVVHYVTYDLDLQDNVLKTCLYAYMALYILAINTIYYNNLILNNTLFIVYMPHNEDGTNRPARTIMWQRLDISVHYLGSCCHLVVLTSALALVSTRWHFCWVLLI